MLSLALAALLTASPAELVVPVELAVTPFDWQPWEAQVTNVCGPGKTCSVRLLTVTGQQGANGVGITLGNASNNLAGICIANSAATVRAYLFQRTSTQLNVYGCSARDCSSCGTNVWSWDSSGGTNISFLTLIGSVGLASGATGTGTAFGSFPACGASNAGRLLYDSTSSLWRWCHPGSTSWVELEGYSAPTISAGFGTSPSITGGTAGARAFTVTVGTGGTATNGTVDMNQQATNGWNCTCTNFTSNATLVCVQCTDSTAAAGPIQFCSRNYAGTTTAFNAGDQLKMQCKRF